MRLFVILCAALSMAACTTTTASDARSIATAAPLQSTVIDERALIVAFEAFDTVLYVVNVLITAGAIEPGSERALALSQHIATAQHWLNSAHEAQRIGNNGLYAAALDRAKAAIISSRTDLGLSNDRP